MLTVFALPLLTSAPWTSDSNWRAAAANRTATSVPIVKLSLDLEPSHRWDQIGPVYAKYVPGILDYLRSEVPAWALPVLQKIGQGLRPYFGEELGGEMEGLSKAMGIEAGYEPIPACHDPRAFA